MKYEIQPVDFGEGFHHESIIGTLTGLPFEDIRKVTEKFGNHWRGRSFIEAFQELGFSTNQRFIKFAQHDQYPCVMRTKISGDPSHWYAVPYYDQKVYMMDGAISLSAFRTRYPDYKITSMLQVWV